MYTYHGLLCGRAVRSSLANGLQPGSKNGHEICWLHPSLHPMVLLGKPDSSCFATHGGAVSLPAYTSSSLVTIIYPVLVLSLMRYMTAHKFPFYDKIVF